MLDIEDHDELLALNRALMETRYLADNVDHATRGSVFLSRLHGRLLDEIIDALSRSGQSAQAKQWKEWRRIETRSAELPRIVAHLRVGWNAAASESRKREIVANQLVPFEFSEDDLQRVIAQLDSDAGHIL